MRAIARAKAAISRVLRRLDVPAKVKLGRVLPWPYNGMVADIARAIETGCNYLAAVGLRCYTEVCGRELLFGGDPSQKDWECFNEFVRYMGVGDLLEKEITFEGRRIHFKDAVRNGLAKAALVVVPLFALFCGGPHRALDEKRLP